MDEKILEPVNQPMMVAGISRPPPKKIFIPTGVVSPHERIRLLTQGVAAPKTSSPLLEGSPDEIARKATDFLFQKKILP